MHGPGKSDRRVVPTKPPNNEVGSGKRDDGRPYSGTKVETPDTDKGTPKVERSRGERSEEGVEGRRLAKGNSPQQNTRRTQGRGSVHSALQRIREVARRDRKLQFTSLFHHVYNVDLLREAYFRLKRDAAPGVDGVTWRQYGKNLEGNLSALSARLKGGGYRAQPVRRSYIPKRDGKRRALGVTVLEDKLVQRAVVEVLNQVYEVDFLGLSYGFRPGRSQHDASAALCVGIEYSRVGWVLDADIRGFFDAIDHDWMLKFVEHRIGDRRVLRLIQKWLKADVLEDGKRMRRDVGSPQGGSVSPLLANIYLHYAFDLWAHHWRRQCRGDVRIIRFADDIVVCFQHRKEAEQFETALRDRLARFGLDLHPDKTRLIEFGWFAAERRARRGLGKPETFNFLGFTHLCTKSRKGHFRVERRTMSERKRTKLTELNVTLRRRRHAPIPVIGKWLRSVLEGHYRYYGVPLNYRSLARFRKEVIRLWRLALLRRSQKGDISWARMERLGQRWLPTPRIYHRFPSEHFRVMTQGRSPVR